MIAWLMRRLGVEDGSSLRGVRLDFDAAWAQGRPTLTLLICAAMGVAAAALCGGAMRQSAGRLHAMRLLGTMRAAAVAGVAALLAEPFITLTLAEPLRPLLVWLFDGTQSMAIRDRLNESERAALSPSLAGDPSDLDDPTRLQLVQRAIAGEANAAIDRLSGPYRQRAYLIDRVDRLRELADDTSPRFTAVRERLTADGLTTALGAALDDVGRRHGGQRLGGVVMVSDFDQNAGPAAEAAADRLGVPVYTVGVGPKRVTDLSVQIQAPLVVKKDEPTSVTAHVRQTGLEGRSASLVIEARAPAETEGGALSSYEPIAPPRQVSLTGPTATIDLPFTPRTTGRYLLAASIAPLAGEVLEVNNRAERAIVVRDESLKLLFVEHEPTWEWRFVKEVFHRDRLVGRRGFRTYLQSADFNVRRRDELFIETLFQPRGELLSQDVIVLSDVPGEMLPESFQRLVHEFVERFGGGLVVIAGPRHGVGALRGTMIADMLPVVLDAERGIQDEPFELRLTGAAQRVPFMRLGDEGADAGAADQTADGDALAPWSNLGPLPWYQPVARPHPLATVLAHHSADLCADGRTPQPIIAMRRYGRGEVVYIGFNELWRLRRLHGEQYYRRFWAGVIYRLGLSRALGSQKRFQVGTDRSTYQAGDTVRITVEAYDEAFNPLNQPLLTARLVAEGDGSDGDGEGRSDAVVRRLTIPLSRDQVIYEATATVDAAGEHRLLVLDPVTDREVEAAFQVAPATIEQRDAVRNVALQQSLADRTGGKTYELHELARLAADIGSPRDEQTFERHVAIGHTWVALAVVLLLLLGEWALRARWNLR